MLAGGTEPNLISGAGFFLTGAKNMRVALILAPYNLVIGRGRQRATGAYKRGRALPEVIQAASNGGRIQIHERSFSLLGAFTLSVYPRVSAVYT